MALSLDECRSIPAYLTDRYSSEALATSHTLLLVHQIFSANTEVPEGIKDRALVNIELFVQAFAKVNDIARDSIDAACKDLMTAGQTGLYLHSLPD